MVKWARQADTLGSGLRFLLAAEDTSVGSAAPAQSPTTGWQNAKTVVWITGAVLLALVIGQL